MRIFKTLALAATAALSLATVASANGYYPTNGHAPAAQVHAPGTGYVQHVNYHGHGNGHGNGHVQQGGGHYDGHGPDYYRVHGVASHDHLNVRHGPGVRNHVIYQLPYNARGIQVGNCTQISTSHGPATWCVVNWNGYQSGWVNARYLAEDYH